MKSSQLGQAVPTDSNSHCKQRGCWRSGVTGWDRCPNPLLSPAVSRGGYKVSHWSLGRVQKIKGRAWLQGYSAGSLRTGQQQNISCIMGQVIAKQSGPSL